MRYFRVSENITAVTLGSKSQIFEVPVIHRENRYVLCDTTYPQHDLRGVLPRSSIKKLFGSFSRKRTLIRVQTNVLNSPINPNLSLISKALL